MRLRLTGDDGKPLVVTIPSLGTASEFTMALAPGATRMVQTDGVGNLVAGAATVTTYTRIGLSAIFSIYDTAGNFVTEAGVGDSQTVIGFVIPVDITGDFNTGLALFNPEPVETTVDLTLLDATGKESGKKSLKLAPGGHLARFIAGPDQLFPSTTDFRGMLSVRRSTYIPALSCASMERLSPTPPCRLWIFSSGSFPSSSRMSRTVPKAAGASRLRFFS